MTLTPTLDYAKADEWAAQISPIDGEGRTANLARCYLSLRNPWRTIESAPRDGTNFLSLNERQGNLMAVTWFDRGHRYFCATAGQHLYQFTHWMPLPAPPRGNQQ